ncbi:hypothetical protein B0H11DRAFT_541028 [Mycena galericulata]|nr:hypothetical protein B0H11DRAFT_541028 [Mycena galericulata]
MDSSSKGSFSDSTIDGFSIKLQTAPLDTFTGLVGDATAARIRYLERRLGDTRIPLPPLPAQTTVTGPSSPSVIQNPSDHMHALPMHNLVPVHSNLGPGPALDPKDATYDQFLTTTVRTESLGSYCQAVGTLIFGDPHDPQNRKKTRDFRLEFDLGSSDLLVSPLALRMFLMFLSQDGFTARTARTRRYVARHTPRARDHPVQCSGSAIRKGARRSASMFTLPDMPMAPSRNINYGMILCGRRRP